MAAIKRLFLFSIVIGLIQLFFYHTDFVSFNTKRFFMLLTIHVLLYFSYYMIYNLYKTKSETGLRVTNLIIFLGAICIASNFISFYGNMSIFNSHIVPIIPLIISAGIFGGFLAKKVLNGSGVHKLVFLVGLGVVNILATHALNIDFDFREPIVKIYDLKNKEEPNNGASVEYRLEIQDESFKHIFVDEKTYVDIRPEGKLKLWIKPGLFNNPWVYRAEKP